MKKLNIAICDDNRTILNEEVEIIHEVLGEKNISAEITPFLSPQTLLLSGTRYDIVFLDIEMGEISGLSAAQKIRLKNKDCLFFFVTNYEKYRDGAGDQRAFRYWIKPLDKERLRTGLDSAIREIEQANRFITVTVHSQEVKVFINSIINVFALERKVHITTVKGELTADTRYKELLNELKQYENFFETSRGCCVNFIYVTDYDKDIVYSRYKDTELKTYLSRRKREEFYKRFSDWIGAE